MLLILFQIGAHHYGLNTDNIVEIIPAIPLRSLPGTPEYLAGIFDYRGEIVPVIDISTLTIKKPAKVRLSTRIILFKFNFEKDQSRIIGLLAENMTDTLEVDPSKIQDTGITASDAPHLGPIIEYEDKLIQCVDIQKLISSELQKKLFSTHEAS